MFKVVNGGIYPTRGSKYSAAVDLYASEDVTILAGYSNLIGLGVCLTELDESFKRSSYLQLMVRSGLSEHLMMANGVGIVDLDYEDEIKIRLYNPSIEFDYFVAKGQKIAQIMLMEHKSYMFGIESDVERCGGFGSTGE